MFDQPTQSVFVQLVSSSFCTVFTTVILFLLVCRLKKRSFNVLKNLQNNAARLVVRKSKKANITWTLLQLSVLDFLWLDDSRQLYPLSVLNVFPLNSKTNYRFPGTLSLHIMFTSLSNRQNSFKIRLLHFVPTPVFLVNILKCVCVCVCVCMYVCVHVCVCVRVCSER